MTFQVRTNHSQHIILPSWPPPPPPLSSPSPSPPSPPSLSAPLSPLSPRWWLEPHSFYLSERATGHHFGGLSPSLSRSASLNTLTFTKRTVMKDHLPVPRDVLQAWKDVPLTVNLRRTNPKHSVVYLSDPLPSPTLVCAGVSASVRLRADGPRWQLVGYLYEVDPQLQGQLLSSGSSSCWNCTANVQSHSQIYNQPLSPSRSNTHTHTLTKEDSKRTYAYQPTHTHAYTCKFRRKST